MDLEKDENEPHENDRLVSKEENETGVEVLKMHSLNSSLKSPIRKCIKIVSRKPEKSRLTEGQQFSGYLNVKKRNLRWKKRWVVLNKGNGEITFYKDESLKKTHNKGHVVYIYVKKLQKIDDFTAKQIEEGKPVCTQHMVFFTKSRSYIVCGDSDEDINLWKEPAIETLKQLFPEPELKEKRSAAKYLFPLIEEQVFIEWRKYEYLRQVLSESLIVCHIMPKPILSGYLSLLTKSGTWKTLYCALHKKYFQYYDPKDKKIPVGVIALKYICDLQESKNETDFRVVTPLCVHTFRAKHSSARQSWMTSIAEVKATKKNGGTKLDVEDKDASLNAPPISGKLVLRYGKKGKKSYTLKEGVTMIGRGSVNDLKIMDSRISRNHAKIVIDPGKGPIYHDLGSQSGSLINDQPVETKVLSLGDKIQIGETILVLESA